MGIDAEARGDERAIGERLAGISRQLEPFLMALLLTLLVFEVIVLAYHQSPWDILQRVWRGTFGTGYGLGMVLFKATPLIFTGLSVGVAFRAGLFNVGAEGQAALGALAAATVGSSLPSVTPSFVALPACIVSAWLAGAILGAIPGALKALFGAHEVITTIMLNFVALAFSSYCVVTYLALPETLHTAPVIEGARLMRLEEVIPAMKGAPANSAFLLALCFVALSTWALLRTVPGFELRAVGQSNGASRSAGIDLKRVTVMAMAMAGGLAGLAGTHFVLGYKYYHEEGFTGGVGFLGIAVAILAKGNPIAMVLSALFLATLSQGGMAINALVPKETMEVLQGVLILAVAASSFGRREARYAGQ